MMKLDKNTKEGRKQLLDAFIERCSVPVEDQTNFSSGSKVHGSNASLRFTVVVTQRYGVAVSFSGYGWWTTATAEQQEHLRNLAAEINGLAEFECLQPQEGPDAL